jgi:hypothetical protein
MASLGWKGLNMLLLVLPTVHNCYQYFYYVSIFSGPVHAFLLTDSTVILKVASTDLEIGSPYLDNKPDHKIPLNCQCLPSFMAKRSLGTYGFCFSCPKNKMNAEFRDVNFMGILPYRLVRRFYTKACNTLPILA